MPNVKILVLSHPLGNVHGSSMARWKARGRGRLVLIELFSLALMAAALLSEFCQNQRFLKGWVTSSVFFGRWGRRS